MRRFDKKQNILEANLRLEESHLSDEDLMDKYLEEAKKEFIGNNLNEGIVAGAIGSALAGGKLLDLLGTGLKKLMKFLVKMKIVSPDGKTFNKSEKVSKWLKEKGEWWSEKVMSFFNWVAGVLVDHFIKQQNPHIDKSKTDETKKNLGTILFYLTITGFGLTALMSFSHLGAIMKGIEGVAVAVKGYEMGAVVVGTVMYFMVKELSKYNLRDVIHVLESCVEDVTHSTLKFGENTECTLKKITEKH
jgi:hypothetical protein